MMKRSSSPSILADGFQKVSDVSMETGEEEQDDDCVFLEVINQSESIKRERIDSSTISEGGFKSVSSGTILGKKSSDLSTSEPPTRSGSLARSLPEQVNLETGEDETAAPRPSSSRTMSQENHRRDVANRRSSSGDELSDLEENRGTKRAYEGESSFEEPNKRFADSHHPRSRDRSRRRHKRNSRHHKRHRSRHYERDRERRSRRRSRSSRRRYERRGLDQDFDRGFGSESYGPRGNSRWRKVPSPAQFEGDNTSPSKIHKNYHGSSEMAGSSQSARPRDELRNPGIHEDLRTLRESVKDMNVSFQSTHTQTEASWIVPSSPRVEKEKDNVDAARPTTTQNYNVSSYCPAGPSNRDLTRRRPEVKDILQKLQNCPCCEFRGDRRETRKHLKIAHKKELCLFCLPETYCVVHRSVESLRHFNEDHAFSEEYGRAKCPLCPNVFTYEGIYKHMSRMHFTPIEPKEPDSEED